MKHSTSSGKPAFYKYLFLGLIVSLAGNAQAQLPVTFTYNGVQYTVSNADTPNSPNYSFDNYIVTHPNSTRRVDGNFDNGRYDCHAFAWANNTEVWIQTQSPGTNVAPQIYYSQLTYYETSTASDAEIAVYGDPINYPVHSALHLTNATASTNGFARKYLNLYPQYAGWWISKWDGGPLAIHLVDSCPFYISQVTYYKKTVETGTNYIEYKGSLYSIFGPNAVCTSGSTFKLNNTVGTDTINSFPPGYSVSWSGSSHISFSPNANAYPVTVTSSTNGTGEWIKATITFPDGSSDTVARVWVWSGLPTYISSISTSQFTAGGNGSTAITVSQSNTELYGWPFNTSDVVPPNGRIDTHGASSYYWTCSGLTYTQNPALSAGYRYTQGGFSSTGAAVMTIHASNACGTTSEYQALNVSSGGEYEYALYPNPASGQVTVNISNKDSQGTAQNAAKLTTAATGTSSGSPVTYTVRVIDVSGVVYYTSRKTGNSFTIPVNNLKTGNYIVELSDGKTLSSKPLLVTH